MVTVLRPLYNAYPTEIICINIESQFSQGTLMTLALEIHTICFTKELLEKEISNLRHAFVALNGYLKWVVSQVIYKFELDPSTSSSESSL